MPNKILKASPSGSAKNYVAELERQPGTLQDINQRTVLAYMRESAACVIL